MKLLSKYFHWFKATKLNCSAVNCTFITLNQSILGRLYEIAICMFKRKIKLCCRAQGFMTAPHRTINESCFQHISLSYPKLKRFRVKRLSSKQRKWMTRNHNLNQLCLLRTKNQPFFGNSRSRSLFSTKINEIDHGKSDHAISFC